MLGRAIERPEHAEQEIGLQRGLRPVHPALDARARSRIRAPELLRAVARREVPQNRVRLPDHRAAVVDHRHAAVRVHGGEFRRIEPAEPAAELNMFMRQRELAHQPHDFLGVERAHPPEDFQHGDSLFLPRSPILPRVHFLSGATRSSYLPLEGGGRPRSGRVGVTERPQA